MPQKRRILFVTERRADYSRLRPLLRAISEHNSFEPFLVVTGAHLSRTSGFTKQMIEADGFRIDARLPILTGGAPDTGQAMAESFGRAVVGMARILSRAKPYLVVAGFDVGSSLATAIAAVHANIPVAHLEGGAVSGTIDEMIRHAITKFSHLHFPATRDGAMRIKKLGENPRFIFPVGSLSIDALKHLRYPARSALFTRFRLNPQKRLLILVHHPVTTEEANAAAQIHETIGAVREMQARFDLEVLAVYPNTDAGGGRIRRALERSGLSVLPFCTHEDFLSLLKEAAVLVGNSSAGIQEAPSFHLPVVNIGTRQQGRERGGNIIDADYRENDIAAAIARALSDEKFLKMVRRSVNPYGGGRTAEKILKILETTTLPPLQKVLAY